MPIKQERMIALLSAADSLSQTIKNAATFVSTTASAIPPSPSPDELLTALQAIQSYMALISIPHQHLEAIATEKAHFKLNEARNKRHAARARRNRTSSPLPAPTPTTAPPNTSPPNTSQPAILSDIELARLGVDFAMADQKMAINEYHSARNMVIPYPDPYDDSVPLTDEHKRYLGLPVETSKTLF